MKYIYILLMSVVISSCTTKREVHYVREKPQAKIEVVTPEDDLLNYPCRAIPAGESLIELAINYNKNVRCIKLYQIQLEKIRKDVSDKEKQHVN